MTAGQPQPAGSVAASMNGSASTRPRAPWHLIAGCTLLILSALPALMNAFFLVYAALVQQGVSIGDLILFGGGRLIAGIGCALAIVLGVALLPIRNTLGPFVLLIAGAGTTVLTTWSLTEVVTRAGAGRSPVGATAVMVGAQSMLVLGALVGTLLVLVPEASRRFFTRAPEPPALPSTSTPAPARTTAPTTPQTTEGQIPTVPRTVWFALGLVLLGAAFYALQTLVLWFNAMGLPPLTFLFYPAVMSILALGLAAIATRLLYRRRDWIRLVLATVAVWMIGHGILYVVGWIEPTARDLASGISFEGITPVLIETGLGIGTHLAFALLLPLLLHSTVRGWCDR